MAMLEKERTPKGKDRKYWVGVGDCIYQSLEYNNFQEISHKGSFWRDPPKRFSFSSHSLCEFQNKKNKEPEKGREKIHRICLSSLALPPFLYLLSASLFSCVRLYKLIQPIIFFAPTDWFWVSLPKLGTALLFLLLGFVSFLALNIVLMISGFWVIV